MKNTILDEIIKFKLQEITERKKLFPLRELKKETLKVSACRDFRSAVFNFEEKSVSIVAEIKRFSPSRGILRSDLDPVKMASLYGKSGASAISVLLDSKFFGGSLDDLKLVRDAVSLPILAKEFIIDEYQIYEAKLAGADAVLLIARILEKENLLRLYEVAEDLGLACIVEIHTSGELSRIKSLPPSVIIGINNRNLENFKVDLGVTRSILRFFPSSRNIISESGIKNVQDIIELKKMGVKAFLIGEAILKSKDPARKLKEFCSG